MLSTCQLGNLVSTSPAQTYLQTYHIPQTYTDIPPPLKEVPSQEHQECQSQQLGSYNWAVELETYSLKFEYIQGIKNTLADTLTRLIDINPDVKLPEEKPGQEFGYHFLEDLPPIEVGEIIVEGVEIKPDPNTFLKDIDLTLPLQPEALRALQA